ncbi:valine--tRNA ligase [Thermodesulfobacteriota bacterium]
MLEKVYDPKSVEEKRYAEWIENDLFKADLNDNKKAYSIVIPPPNVTGVLHMGHALNSTLQDVLARYKRMKGFSVLWLPGMDHAGIATQNVVEKQLAKEGKTRHHYTREEFVERVWTWKEEYGGRIINQLKKLGASCDWSRERFTMDEGLSEAVKEVFIRLYDEKLIYKGDYIINWCPRCHTALSDLEVDFETKNGKLYYMNYPLEDGNGFIPVATTRPETMLGDTAVAVNPDDERYKDYIGKRVTLPVMNRSIEVIGDHYVEAEFGTGAVKITPAHDINDFEMGLRHDLEMITVMNEDGTMNENAGKYNGLDRYECRDKLVGDLQASGVLTKIEDYVHNVGECYRCKTVIEPTLSKQWFIKTAPLAKEAIGAVKNGKTKIIPKTWEKTYFNWMENIRDWCISRQIWWGHRIPAYYCDYCEEVMVQKSAPEACTKCGSSNITQESDVLDTWFSSALWPFSTLGWPNESAELKKFYPTSVLVTGFDILFFWVARMMMMGIKFMDEIPFHDVYLHALVRDKDGHKMSKSRGNVIDPLLIIDKFGTDSFRYTLSAFAAQGRDIRMSEDRIEGYRNFINKIWNASRFALMNLEDYDPKSIDPSKLDLKLEDKWILSRVNETAKKVNEELDAYRFNEAAGALYHFTWHELCDWYIEFIKTRLYGKDGAESRITAQYVLADVLNTVLKLLHPFIPFVTEEIFQSLPGNEGFIMRSSYPEFNSERAYEDAVKSIEAIMDVISAIRNIRGEMNVTPSLEIKAYFTTSNDAIKTVLSDNKQMVKVLAKLSVFESVSAEEKSEKAAVAVLKDMELTVPLEGIIDFESEEKRLSKEIEKIDKDLNFLNKKLSNEKFVNNAPKEIVEKEQEKLNDFTIKRETLTSSLERLSSLRG